MVDIRGACDRVGSTFALVRQNRYAQTEGSEERHIYRGFFCAQFLALIASWHPSSYFSTADC